METKRRRQLTLGALIVMLMGLMAYEVLQRPAAAPRTSSNGVHATGRRAAGKTGPPEAVPDVRLQTLAQTRPEPLADGRNLFQFGSAPARPTGGPGLPGGGPPRPGGGLPGPPAAVRPPVAAPAPPIPLKFIGIVDAPGQTGRLAVLTDGRDVFHGREGDIIGGRYRIVHIGIESIELSYLDGSGRQMIRLTGGGV